MLLREQFGGGHDRALVAIEGSHQERGGGHCCFACANISLQQAAHGPVLREITEDFDNHASLRIGETEWQGCLERFVGGDT